MKIKSYLSDDNLTMNEAVSILVDDIAIFEDDGVFDFNSHGVTYEQLKELVIDKVSAAVKAVLHDKDLSPDQKLTTLISTYTYSTMQNFILWHTLMHHKK